MSILSQNLKYLPHDLNTRFFSCKTYSSKNYSIKDICRKYHVSKSSLMRWMKQFDGTKESLVDKPKTPKTVHPNAHTAKEIADINNLLHRNPNIGLSELYGKLKHNYAYTRHPSSLFRFLRKQGIYAQVEHKKEVYIPKPYITPEVPGEKMQLDVKYVPRNCYKGKLEPQFFQYTIIDEATRERFIYAYNEQSSHSTRDFVIRSIIYFGYIPKCIQTDNGFEFTTFHSKKDISTHLLDQLCELLGITHKLIKPRTPRHNGKVERSHRNDQKRFYDNLSFFSLDDLNIQMKAYLKRSNNIPSNSLNWKSQIEQRNELTKITHFNKSLLKPFINNKLISYYNI
jgi:transposase InsO family protein